MEETQRHERVERRGESISDGDEAECHVGYIVHNVPAVEFRHGREEEGAEAKAQKLEQSYEHKQCKT